MIRFIRFLTLVVFTASAVFFAGAATLYVMAGGSLRSLVASPLPPHAPLAIGMDYRLSLSCPGEFEIVGTVWHFDRAGDWPGPQGFWIFEDVGTPYSVSGVVRLSSPVVGIFAPNNGREMPIHYTRDGQPGMACL